MREALLAMPEGAFLGTETTVLKRFATSRPTLRQAARLLEFQQLLVVKMGPAGGYSAARPSQASLIAAVIVHLHTQAYEFSDHMVAVALLNEIFVHMAVLSKNEGGRIAPGETFEAMEQCRARAVSIGLVEQVRRTRGLPVVARGVLCHRRDDRRRWRPHDALAAHRTGCAAWRSSLNGPAPAVFDHIVPRRARTVDSRCSRSARAAAFNRRRSCPIRAIRFRASSCDNPYFRAR